MHFTAPPPHSPPFAPRSVHGACIAAQLVENLITRASGWWIELARFGQVGSSTHAARTRWQPCRPLGQRQENRGQSSRAHRTYRRWRSCNFSSACNVPAGTMAKVRSSQALRCQYDNRGSHIDPPTSLQAIMRRKPYREENCEPGRYKKGALDQIPGIREQPPDKPTDQTRADCSNSDVI